MSSPNAVEEFRGATRVVETCAAVEPGESVLVVTDWRVEDVAHHVAAAAEATGAEVTMTAMEPREYDGNEPPATVAKRRRPNGSDCCSGGGPPCWSAVTWIWAMPVPYFL